MAPSRAPIQGDARERCFGSVGRGPPDALWEMTVTDHLLLNLAYIDPGSGTLLLQFLLAGFVGGMVFFRNQVAGLASWIRHKAFARKS